MASFEENRELSTSKPSISSKNSVFSRSMTTHSSVANTFSKKGYVSSAASTVVDRNAANMKKWYSNTFDSAVEESPYNHHLAKLRPAKSFSSDFKDCWSILDVSTIRFPGTEDRVVVYFTSLRGIRRTREDCDAVRMIFRAYKVFVDERDVSMDAAYRKEIQGLLGEKNVTLPQVFIKGRYVGGVELIRQWNETGELRKILQSLPTRDRRFVCDSCGDVRFLPCSNCSGSRKIFDEDEEVMKRCLECNENGLIRCPECCL
uniref:Glutaredoxin domain-containing protein n=1 Tax=Chenopodium quinoa TaxID=63459 RepID=A0A803MYB6_CHEQI